MSVSLSAERDRLQQQVEELEQSLSVTHAELELLSSDTGDESDDDDDTDDEGEQSAAGLLAEREKIQKEIQNLESALGPHGPISVSDDDNDSSSSEESEMGLPPTADSCLQLNLVYQQVIQDTLDQLETLLEQNKRQQREVMTQLSGSIKEAPKEQNTSSSYDPSRLFLGRFFKPYFKDKLTGLGPPANQETKEKASRLMGCLDGRSLKHKRWESWQKTLLIHSVARDTLRRLIQPKLSKIDYLSQKMLSAAEADRQQFRQQIDRLEEEINELRKKTDDDLVGERFDEHDWQKIANVDFEGTRNAEDIQRFWQNFLHPAINKTRWTKEEVELLKVVCRRHNERDWEAIASDLGTGRTGFLCLQTFQRFVSGSLRNSSWTPAEDAQLTELVEKMRIGNFIPYTQMSYFMEGRDHCQLIYRWTQVLDPSLRKGPWTKEEDELLLKAVAQYGEKEWWRIRSEVPGRTDGACRDRYLDCLKADRKRGPFEIEEEILLLSLVEKHGVGRWSKIAAEIPHRTDAQCMRMWRKLSRRFPKQTCSKAKKSPCSSGGQKKRKKTNRMAMKEEFTDEEDELEEEDVVVYMESDEEEVNVQKREKVEKMRGEEVEGKEETEYTFPPLKEWVPSEKVTHTFLIFQPVELPSTRDTYNVNARSTILGLYGRSVIIGPRPRIQPSQNRHSNRTMMMVSADQLRIYMSHKADKHNQRAKGRRKQRSRVTDKGLGYQLQAGVIPLIGNILIPAKTIITEADIEREQGEKRELCSTSVFLFFLQTMSVDTVGCKEMIEQSRNKVIQSAPAPDPSSVKPKNLQSKELQEHTQILEQLHVLKQTKPMQLQQTQQVIVLQQALSPNKPGVLLNMPPNTSPQMMFPPAVFISQPFQQPIQFMPLSTLTKPGVIVCSPPSAPQKMNSPPLTVVTKPGLNQLCPSPSPSSAKTPAKRQRTKKIKVQERLISSHQQGDISTEGDGSSGTSTGVDTDDHSKNKNGGRIRKPSEKAKALQVTIQEKAESKKKKTPWRQQTKTAVPQTPPSSLTNPITDLKTESPNVPLVPVDPASSDGDISSTQNVIVVPPSPIPTNQDTSSFTDSSLSDHNYVNPCPSFSSRKPSCSTKQTKFKASKSRSTTKKTPKAPPKKRKQVSKGLEQSSQEDQSLTKTDDATEVKSDAVTVEGEVAAAKDGGSTGLPQNGRRVRKPSQKAREFNQAMAEATKKKSLSSPPKKRSRKSGSKKERVTLKQTVAPVQGWCLQPSQPMGVMTPTGIVQLMESPPQGLRLAIAPRTPKSKQVSPPLRTLAPRPGPPLTLITSPARPLPSAFILQPVPNPLSTPLPAQKAAPSSSTLQFDPSLMFMESRAEVQDWLSGQGGVDIPGAGVTLPYLPPFVSNLSTLSELLRNKKSLTKLSLQLLSQVSESQPELKTTSKADRISQKTGQHSEVPDSTSDIPAAPPVSSKPQNEEEVKEEELVAVVRQLVAERFAGNPAYQLLKARFLSCFTVPALLATFKPITEKTVATDVEEEKDEEEEKIRKIKQRGKERRAQKSSFQCYGSGPPASHFSGLEKHTSKQARQDQAAAVQ